MERLEICSQVISVSFLKALLVSVLYNCTPGLIVRMLPIGHRQLRWVFKFICVLVLSSQIRAREYSDSLTNILTTLLREELIFFV